MKTKIIFYIVLMMALNIDLLYSQERQLLNKINPVFTIYLEKSNDLILFHYTLGNGLTAEQPIWSFELHLNTKIVIVNMNIPPEWRGNFVNEGNDLKVVWGTTTNADVQPGQSLSGYSISAISILGIVPYYTEGWVPSPDSIAEDYVQDSIYHNLTPYGPGVVGKTIGPAPIPNPFIHTAFLDTLVSYTQQVYDLQWLGDSHFLSRINRDLTQAKRTLDRGDSSRCASEIISFQKNIQEEFTATTQQKGKHIPYVSSEAYYLLYYNAQYLIDRLPRPTKGKQ